MKDIIKDMKKLKDIPYCWIGKINITEMSIVLLSNLQIQFNPCKYTNDILYRISKSNPKNRMETQKTLNSQSNPEQEKPSWRHHKTGF